ncbi:MAG: aldo/keto reductase [Lachnospiraceae bacterium]|nr:aldo/keto reductase [Lachnospiraceae bacterium]
MDHTVTLANGVTVPALGLGTWYLGDDPRTRQQELEGLRAGVEEGMTLIDTAEMYGGGRSEALVGEAIEGMDREKLFLVSKVLPNNAGGKKMEKALHDSMQRMGVDYLDLYLYHWRGGYPLEETVDCLNELQARGRIRAWGVSNFDIDDMEELWETPGGQNCIVNQVLYNVSSRGTEYSLLPWMREHGIALMAYCPLAQGGGLARGLMQNKVLQEIADAHGITVPQLILAWDIRDGNTIAIPRSSRAEHTRSNAAADKVTLTEDDLHRIDAVFPAPTHKVYLDIQ